jgi:polyribonucleotide nucleotidyltransferase
MNASIEFYAMLSFDGKTIAEDIVITACQAAPEPTNLEGTTHDGEVKNVTDFGVFVKIHGAPDGLLHKNGLSRRLKNNFKEELPIGKKVRVKIEKVTEKGLQLVLIEN